jgi:hypothetical protein
MMEAVCTSEVSVCFYKTSGTISQKVVIFRGEAVPLNKQNSDDLEENALLLI